MKCDSLLKPPASKAMKAGRVLLEPGEEVGEHITENKEEVIVVLRGAATIIEGGKEAIVKEKETHYIREGIRYNIKNKTGSVVEYVYVAGSLG